MKFSRRVVEWIARRFNVPGEAVRMFHAANELSGLNGATLPRELVPMNAIQFTRGLLNFTVLQGPGGWVLPYWAVQQMDRESLSFIPRSHLGLFVNVTHRNWTAVGNPHCCDEPIVDPRGMVTPFRNGWSVDVWLVVDGNPVFPSQTPSVTQCLIHDMPVVRTSLQSGGVELQLLTWTVRSHLFHQAEIVTVDHRPHTCRIAFALRPFNPEGVSLVHDVEFRSEECSFVVGGHHRVDLSRHPDHVWCNTYDEGDVAEYLTSDAPAKHRDHAACVRGLATGVAAFDINLNETEAHAVSCSIPLAKNKEKEVTVLPDPMETVRDWETLLTHGTVIATPDVRLDSAVRASLSSVLMFTDGASVTPGPCLYHQFWFRDAAYMIWALDKFAYHEHAARIIGSFPSYQDRSGHFVAQQGEWDSNGQALWSAWQHLQLSGNSKGIESIVSSLNRGVRWIDRQRMRSRNDKGDAHFGLMPPGLSAEHLGMVDHYFWDNFWSVGGLDAFIRISERLDMEQERAEARSLREEYWGELELALNAAAESNGSPVIPAAPGRRPDFGSVGSCCAFYPLQLFKHDDRRVHATLDFLNQRFSMEGMFFLDFVHSGMNPYLTLQIAHAWLYAGERKKFWDLLTAVLDHASPTMTFPEAIHPMTHGGSMGDGHHGWAAAEVLLAVRDAFVYDAPAPGGAGHEVVFLGGAPAEWFRPGSRFSIVNAPVPEGPVDILAEAGVEWVTIDILLKRRHHVPLGRWFLSLPFEVTCIEADSAWHQEPVHQPGESLLSLQPNSPSIHLRIGRKLP